MVCTIRGSGPIEMDKVELRWWKKYLEVFLKLTRLKYGEISYIYLIISDVLRRRLRYSQVATGRSQRLRSGLNKCTTKGDKLC